MATKYRQELGDGPVEAAYLMKEMGRAIDRFWNPNPKNKKIGFVLMIFPFGDDGRMNYLSNATRADVVKSLREQLRYFEEEDAKKQ